MKIIRILAAIPIIVAMIAFAKFIQFAAVDALGGSLGFNLASLVGVAPVILLYFVAAAKLPDPFKGKARG